MPRSPLSEPGSKTGVQTSEEPLLLDLAGALQRARSYNQQFLSAGIAAALAREDRIQAKAALLPTLNAFNQFIYSSPMTESISTANMLSSMPNRSTLPGERSINDRAGWKLPPGRGKTSPLEVWWLPLSRTTTDW